MASSQLSCRCCLSKESFKNLRDTTDDNVQMYLDSINECFSIKLIYQDDLPHMICKMCVERLKYAQAFRKQIESVQEILSHKQVSAILELQIVDIEDGLDDDKTIDAFDYLKVELKCHSESESCDRKSEPKPKAIPQKSKRQKEASPSKTKHDSRTNLQHELDANSLICPLSKETFPVLKTVATHVKIDFPTYKCSECAKCYNTRKGLARHRVCHGVCEYPCKVCKETFSDKNVLNTHMKAHNPKMRFRCPECDERFINYYMRQKHLINVHGVDQQLYKCEACPMTFVLSGQLSKHTRSVHLQERNYNCQECGEGFFSKFCLHRHMVKHTGAKDFECALCGNEYGRKSTLREHMRVHYNDKRFSCALCGKAFTQKSTLQGHMRAHDKRKEMGTEK